MTSGSKLSIEAPTPKIRRLVFSNPPVNLIVPETVTQLHDAIKALSNEPSVQVVIITSSNQNFFLNHFDLRQAHKFPVLSGVEATPAWVDLVISLSKAPFVSIAAIRGRTRGGGNELSLACDLRYASKELALFSQPEVGTGILPGVAAPSDYLVCWAGTEPLKQSLAARITTPTPPSVLVGSRGRCRTQNLIGLWTRWQPALHRSTRPFFLRRRSK